jgi:hypothetical protein
MRIGKVRNRKLKSRKKWALNQESKKKSATKRFTKMNDIKAQKFP